MCCTQVDELEAAAAKFKQADRSDEVAAAEARIKSLQGVLQRRDDAVRDLRDRVDTLNR